MGFDSELESLQWPFGIHHCWCHFSGKLSFQLPRMVVSITAIFCWLPTALTILHHIADNQVLCVPHTKVILGVGPYLPIYSSWKRYLFFLSISAMETTVSLKNVTHQCPLTLHYVQPHSLYYLFSGPHIIQIPPF